MVEALFCLAFVWVFAGLLWGLANVLDPERFLLHRCEFERLRRQAGKTRRVGDIELGTALVVYYVTFAPLVLGGSVLLMLRKVLVSR